jgi:adenosylcobinamide-GDP ribazoletransferase
MGDQKSLDSSEKSTPGNPMLGFAVALQFLTVSPAFIRRDFSPRELGQATAYFPLVGALIGAILWGSSLLLGRIFPPTLRAALILAIWVLLSGALHLDGFLDSCDGLFGGGAPEARLEIMRDERVGAFALAGGVLLMLLKFSAISTLPEGSPALLIAPTLGRWGMTLSIFAFPYARPQGLGKAMKEFTGAWQVGLGTLLAVGIAWPLAGQTGLLACLVAAPITWLVAAFALRRIPGLTGDVYGAINEMVELAVLITFVALQP